MRLYIFFVCPIPRVLLKVLYNVSVLPVMGDVTAQAIYLNDCYQKEFESIVQEVNNGKYIVLGQTLFYPNSGGQPNDTGILITEDGHIYKVVSVAKSGNDIMHEADHEGLKQGDKVKGIIDWDRRYKHMRMHTAAHILDAVLYNEAGALCTGNQLGYDKSRIDFALDEFDRDKMEHYIKLANSWVEKKIDVKTYYLPRDEALKIPGIVKLAAIMPPEIKELRIVEIPGIDLQADGGTQVKNTGEIGKIVLLSVENKGKKNRRLYYELAE